MSDSLRLNLGCGSQVVDGWTNVDYALGARLGRLPLVGALARKAFNTDWDPRIVLHDLRERFPWADGSARAVYSSHTLEHLNREQGRHFLKECCRVLAPGGVLRIVVPDLRHIAEEYLAGRLAADHVLEELYVVHPQPRSLVKKLLVPYVSFPHQCMYDNETLVGIFRELGLEAAVRGAFDSAIPDIRVIELADRTEHAVIVEGRKL